MSTNSLNESRILANAHNLLIKFIERYFNDSWHFGSW